MPAMQSSTNRHESLHVNRSLLSRHNASMASPLRPPIAPRGPAQESIADAVPSLTPKLKRHPRREPFIPKKIRKEVTKFAHGLAKEYRSEFTPELKAKVLRLLGALLPPRRQRGRPRDPIITRAMMLRARFQRKFPQEKPRQVWNRICLILIPGYAALPKLDQRAARRSAGAGKIAPRSDPLAKETPGVKIGPQFPPSSILPFHGKLPT